MSTGQGTCADTYQETSGGGLNNDRHQSTDCSVHLVAQREDFQVVHRLFFPGSVDGLQKH